MDFSPDGVEWVEKLAIESMKGRHATAEVIARESATTLTVLVAAMGGALALAVKQVEAQSWTWMTYGVGMLVLYLLILSVLLVVRCMLLAPIPAIYNTPFNLDYGEGDWMHVRRSELRSLQARIIDAAASNERRASALNRLRLALVLSPVIFVISSGAAALLLARL